MRTSGDLWPSRSHRVPIAAEVAIRVRSDSDPLVAYLVQKLPDGSWVCSCPGNSYHGRCKHVDREKAARRQPTILSELLR